MGYPAKYVEARWWGMKIMDTLLSFFRRKPDLRVEHLLAEIEDATMELETQSRATKLEVERRYKSNPLGQMVAGIKHGK